MINLFETGIDHPLLNGDLNLIQMTLVGALQLERRNPDFQWRQEHPKLSKWADKIAERKSIIGTMPPLKQS